jgi:hypothetical protein
MRITTSRALLAHMRACFPRRSFSIESRKSFARIVLYSENTFHDPTTGHLTPYLDNPEWVRRAIAYRSGQ